MTGTTRKRRSQPRTIRGRKGASRRRLSQEPQDLYRPRINLELDPILTQVGEPEHRPFLPDAFQIEALEKLQGNDVIVSVPTGAGKTYIAAEAVRELLDRGGRAWYASPLKALSNSKFLEFGKQFGPDRVGLLTGDHKVNPDSPLIVGTTEILRNQLYDAMNTGENLKADLVVMDEAHYLGDPDRGVVWEEAIIYLPSRVKLLLLSATIANAEELAAWLTSVRGQECRTVLSHKRPVPLHPLFLFPDGELVSLTRGPGLSPRIKQFLRSNPYKRRWGGAYQTPIGRIFKSLALADLLPAIFFLKSRADCDMALTRVPAADEGFDPEKRLKLEARVDEFINKYPFLKDHPHLRGLRAQGIAAHHAGHLPHWKLIVEQLMQEGLLRAIFSTSTVAAGVNFPARTVVIAQSDRFNGHEFADLSATELLQMTGRAGRRGMDRIGFALIVPGPFQDVALISALFESSPEPVRSRMVINFSMTLNLLLSHRPEEIKPLLDLSLADFQRGDAEPETSRTRKDIKRLTDRLNESLRNGLCRDAEQAAFFYRRSRQLQKELDRLKRARPSAERESLMGEVLTPGRLFERRDGQVFCAVKSVPRQDQPGVLAVKVKKDHLLKNGHLQLKWMPLDRVARVLDAVLDFRPEASPRQMAGVIRKEAGEKHGPLDLDKFKSANQAPGLTLDSRIEALKGEYRRLPCRACPLANACLDDRHSENFGLLATLSELTMEAGGSPGALWPSFLRHLDFLRGEGFIRENGELTEDGRWASQLRLDHPVVFAEAIRAGAWPEDDPALLAAMVAPFVVDSDRATETDVSGTRPPRTLAPAWLKLEQAVAPLIGRLKDWGFATPSANPRAARAIHFWTGSDDWAEAVKLFGQGEGDMAMLVFRTADNLRQMASLADTHPELAATARKGMELILKEPVIVPL